MNEDDFIRRKAALNAEIKIEVDIPPYKTRTIKAAEGAVQRAVEAYAEHIKEIPAADVRPVVHGVWKPNPRNPYWLDCTVCGYAKTGRAVYNFCPCCGADMRE